MKKYLLTMLAGVLLSVITPAFVLGIANAQTAQTGGKFLLHRNLFEGVSGDDVKALQRFLIQNGLLAQRLDTGFFGPKTKMAVMKMQEKLGVRATGFVGPMTRKKLMSNGSSTSTGMMPMNRMMSGTMMNNNVSNASNVNVDQDVMQISNELRNSFQTISSANSSANMENMNLEQILQSIKSKWQGPVTFDDTFRQLVATLNQIANSTK